MATGYSYDQLKAALWTGAGARVHALLDGRVLPGLPGLLEQAQSPGWDCLQRGALSAQAAREAAYLVELDPAAPFTDRVLRELPRDFPGFGLVMVSGRALLPMREHCRSLSEVQTPDGERRPWRWWDPELLERLLPEFSPSQLDELFGAGQQIVLIGRAGWTWFALRDGVLAQDARPLLAAASQ